MEKLQRCFDQTALILGGVAIGIMLSLTAGVSLLAKSQEGIISAAQQAGYERGLQSADFKQLAVTDKKFTSSLCTAWWFQTDPTLKGKYVQKR